MKDKDTLIKNLNDLVFELNIEEDRKSILDDLLKRYNNCYYKGDIYPLILIEMGSIFKGEIYIRGSENKDILYIDYGLYWQVLIKYRNIDTEMIGLMSFLNERELETTSRKLCSDHISIKVKRVKDEYGNI